MAYFVGNSLAFQRAPVGNNWFL